ncbi:MAG: non-canonical purine NTP pyrophosphatase [Fimbriimonadaceae bacterium]
MKRLVVATHNVKKAGEMVAILSRRFPGLPILTLADFPDAPEPEETGDSYWANASIKSESAAAFAGEWSLADDAGLEIDAMGGEPGVHSKRFAGEDTPFPEKMALILERLRGVPEPKRTARFRCCVALTCPEGTRLPEPPDRAPVVYRRPRTIVFQATCEGGIAHAPSGNGGFGYDPIFFLPELGCTMADLAADQKHEVSHRGKVLRAVGDYLEMIGAGR